MIGNKTFFSRFWSKKENSAKANFYKGIDLLINIGKIDRVDMDVDSLGFEEAIEIYKILQTTYDSYMKSQFPYDYLQVARYNFVLAQIGRSVGEKNEKISSYYHCGYEALKRTGLDLSYTRLINSSIGDAK